MSSNFQQCLLVANLLRNSDRRLAPRKINPKHPPPKPILHAVQNPTTLQLIVSDRLPMFFLSDTTSARTATTAQTTSNCSVSHRTNCSPQSLIIYLGSGPQLYRHRPATPPIYPLAGPCTSQSGKYILQPPLLPSLNILSRPPSKNLLNGRILACDGLPHICPKKRPLISIHRANA